MRLLSVILSIVLVTLTGYSQSHAQSRPPKVSINDKVIEDVRNWLQQPLVFITLGAQNQKYASLGNNDILGLDQAWRKERDKSFQPMIAATLNNPLSTYLTQIQAKSLGLYVEIFVMDNKGLNAGQSSVTSDFWQGDEDKYLKTFPVSVDEVFIDEPEWDESFKIWRLQVSMTITSETGEKVGVATVEFNMNELKRRFGES
ncbi:hypothetical protein [Emcibacter sp.]|uniref:hypothetical protein n=1 Tax=Emcibacter sp. TaxID=1979954 RepID=UPI003A943F50